MITDIFGRNKKSQGERGKNSDNEWKCEVENSVIKRKYVNFKSKDLDLSACSNISKTLFR